MNSRLIKSASVLTVLSLFVMSLSVGRGALAAENQTPTAATVLAGASKSLAATKTMHFVLKIDGDTYLDTAKSLKLISAEGDIVRPDRVSVQFQVQVLGAGNVSIKMITIGDHSWTTDLITGKWGPAPAEFGYNPAILFDAKHGLGPIMDSLTKATVEGTEKIDGKETYKVTGTATASDINDVTAETMSGTTFPVQIWVDTKTSQPLKITLAESPDNGKEHPATWTMTLSGYDHDVSIDSPVPATPN